MDTITDGEKEVVKTYLTNLLSLLFANGKLCGMIRGAVMIVCGTSAKVTENELTQVSDLLIVVAMFVWSWLEKHYAEKKTKAITSSAFDAGADAMKRAIDVSTGAAASLGDPALWNPPPKAEIKSPANGGFIVTSLGVLITLVALATMLALCGCACDRAAYVRQSCGAGGTNICTVIIMPDGGATVLPMGDSAIKAAADAAMASSGISAAGAAATGAAKAIGTVEAIKASKP